MSGKSFSYQSEIHVWYWVTSAYVWPEKLDIVCHQGLSACIQSTKFSLKTGMATHVPCTEGRTASLPWLPNYHSCLGVHQRARAERGWELLCEQNSRGHCSSLSPLTYLFYYFFFFLCRLLGVKQRGLRSWRGSSSALCGRQPCAALRQWQPAPAGSVAAL